MVQVLVKLINFHDLQIILFGEVNEMKIDIDDICNDF